MLLLKRIVRCLDSGGALLGWLGEAVVNSIRICMHDATDYEEAAYNLDQTLRYVSGAER